MGIGPNYRRNNPYVYSQNSYDSMCDHYKQEIKRLEALLAKNPNPSKFKVEDVYNTGTLTALKVKYDNCTNYEGVKIMVVRSKISDLISLQYLDPHFSDSGLIVARFEPTSLGWSYACNFVNQYS